MQPLVYELTRDEFEEKKKQLEDNGISFDGDAGQATYKGITFGFIFDEPQLTVHIIKKPFLVTESMIASKLNSWLKVI
jgi:hypothetical protein